MRLSDAEWKLMHAIWQGHPACARDVMERLGGDADWAYTTIKTMLNRLVEKGALGARQRANTTMYSPQIDERSARRFALRNLIDTAFEGALGPMMQFLISEKELGAADRVELERLLKEEEKKGGKIK